MMRPSATSWRSDPSLQSQHAGGSFRLMPVFWHKLGTISRRLRTNSGGFRYCPPQMAGIQSLKPPGTC